MRYFVRRITERAGNILIRFAKRIYQTPLEQRVVLWFENQGDKILRLNYELTDNSMVFDLGGYEGQWASDIFSKYCCTIHIFEPVHEFASKIQERFKYNQKIYTHEFGLSNENKTVSISLSKDSSSIYKRNGEQTTAILMRAVDFMRENSIKKIDLMKINIEGGEYDLLEHLIDSDFIRNIDNVQIQFHDFVSDAFHRMSNIQHFLSRTHITTYQYPFVWENWMRKR